MTLKNWIDKKKNETKETIKQILEIPKKAIHEWKTDWKQALFDSVIGALIIIVIFVPLGVANDIVRECNVYDPTGITMYFEPLQVPTPNKHIGFVEFRARMDTFITGNWTYVNCTYPTNKTGFVETIQKNWAYLRTDADEYLKSFI